MPAFFMRQAAETAGCKNNWRLVVKKNTYCTVLACILLAIMAGCAGTNHEKATLTASNSGQHPELTEQEKLTPCSSCHQEVTPEIYQQWYNSRHGLDEVKCFQCHGTFEALKVVPDETTCAACHNAQFQHSPKGKSCWDCHPAHGFIAHR